MTRCYINSAINTDNVNTEFIIVQRQSDMRRLVKHKNLTKTVFISHHLKEPEQ